MKSGVCVSTVSIVGGLPDRAREIAEKVVAPDIIGRSRPELSWTKSLVANTADRADDACGASVVARTAASVSQVRMKV
jgi:hypothetical protein